MASLSYNLLFHPRKCSTIEDNPQKHDQFRLSRASVIGTSVLLTTKFERFTICRKGAVRARAFRIAETESLLTENLKQGVIVERAKYRQTYSIRSTEVGPDKTATFESILKLLQETAVNHIPMIGLSNDGFGTTPEMSRNNVIWVVSRMQVEVHHNPSWGRKIDVDTWYAPPDKNSVRRDWLVRCNSTGLILARATSTWVLMSQTTRRLAKMPETVRTEILPWNVNESTFKQANTKLEKLDSQKAEYSRSNLKANRNDLDMNNHVNNVQYLKWMLEAIPNQVLDTHRLSCIEMEYRKECGSSDVVESLCKPYDAEVLSDELDERQLRYTHLLQIKGKAKMDEIVRGRTTWKRDPFAPHSLMQ